MNEEYKFGEAIPAKDGKRWSDDPEVYALIVENERLREALQSLVDFVDGPVNFPRRNLAEVFESRMEKARAALKETPR